MMMDAGWVLAVFGVSCIPILDDCLFRHSVTVLLACVHVANGRDA